MQEPELDLSISSLMKACKGNVAMLPSFMVHDDHAWPKHKAVLTDSRGRVHLRRSTFNRVVSGQLPLREGVWHRVDVQEFHIDLKPHHLQGSEDQQGGNNRLAARGIAKIDKHGRHQGQDEYGEDLPRDNRQPDIARDVAEAKRAGSSRRIGSNVLGPRGGDE